MDLAESHFAALNYLMLEKKNLINLNIGTGKGFSVLELIKKFEEVNSCKILYEFSPRRKGDISISVANNDLSRSLLNWKPTRDIEDMCRDGWKWCNNFQKDIEMIKLSSTIYALFFVSLGSYLCL